MNDADWIKSGADSDELPDNLDDLDAEEDLDEDDFDDEEDYGYDEGEEDEDVD